MNSFIVHGCSRKHVPVFCEDCPNNVSEVKWRGESNRPTHLKRIRAKLVLNSFWSEIKKKKLTQEWLIREAAQYIVLVPVNVLITREIGERFLHCSYIFFNFIVYLLGNACWYCKLLVSWVFEYFFCFFYGMPMQVVRTNQFSVTKHKRVIRQVSGEHGLPGMV